MVSAERLQALRPDAPLCRIGLSATIAPLETVGEFLCGAGRPCEIVTSTTAKKSVIEVFSPLRKNSVSARRLDRRQDAEGTVRPADLLPHDTDFHQHAQRRGKHRASAQATAAEAGAKNRGPPRLARPANPARCGGPAQAGQAARRRLLDQSRDGHRYRLHRPGRDDFRAERRLPRVAAARAFRSRHW